MSEGSYIVDQPGLRLEVVTTRYQKLVSDWVTHVSKMTSALTKGFYKFMAISAVTAGLVALASSAYALRAMDEDNDPGLLFSEYEKAFIMLPKKGSIAQPTWSDNYWPSYEGGAAQRWQIDPKVQSRNPHYYGLYSPYDIARLTQEQLDLLSPAEKLDIARGRFDYPTVKSEMARTRPDFPKWFGLCHSVAIIASRFKEPRSAEAQISFQGGPTRTIRFFSSDLKALLALSADAGIREAISLGRRCESASTSPSADGPCWDTNPASFYIALTNMVGISREALILDVDPGAEVWNAVVSSYSAVTRPKAERSPKAARGTVREVYVDLTVQHTVGTKPSRSPVGGHFKTRLYKFTLEMNRNGDIIGGEWISKDRPDSIWFTPEQVPMDESYGFLQRIMK